MGEPTPDEPDAYSVTREIALKALDRRAYGRAELASYLGRKGAAPEVVEQVLGRLEEVGLLDDDAFASQWVESRHRVRGASRRALTQELRRKGLEEEVIASAVGQLGQADEVSAARALAEKKARALTGQPRDVALRRTVAALARRGFSGEVSWAAAKEALSVDEVESPE